MKMIDVHAHLTDERFSGEVEKIVENAQENGVFKIVCAGADKESSVESVELAKKFDNVFATVGIHPENIPLDAEDPEKQMEEDVEFLKKYVSKKTVAIGEIGLDYHFFDNLEKDEIEKRKSMQKFLFKRQIELANSLDLPIVVHSRDAMKDTLDILKECCPKRHSLLHCYGGSFESAQELIKMGFSFSFGGVVTFSNAKNVVQVVKELSIEKILLETDCPYLAPVPFRGTRNEPKNVKYVADAIARIKGISMEQVAQMTTQNAERLFEI